MQQLGDPHWRALERCCRSRLGRAQVDGEVAAPLVELGYLQRHGYGYRPTPAGFATYESGAWPPAPLGCYRVEATVATTPSARPAAASYLVEVPRYPGPLRLLAMWLVA